MSLKQWIIRIFAGAVLLVGIGLMLYPIVSNLVFEKRQEALAAFYEEKAREIPPAERSSQWEKCGAYNDALYRSGARLTDPFGDEGARQDQSYDALLNINGDGVMGSMEIPGITGRLVIYHGTEERVLQKGVGHLEGSSLPVGGENTHAVLSAHCGLPSKKLFTNIDQLEVGDVFYLYILGETLAYQVDNRLVVLPNEVDALKIAPGKDFVTLVTCTPYGINSHRLLVRGTRISYEEAKEIELQQKRRASTWRQEYVKALFAGLGIVAVLGIVVFLIRLIRKRTGKQKK